MNSTYKIYYLILLGALILSVPVIPPSTYAQDSDPAIPGTNGLYIELTREFYEALLAKNQRGDRLYSNDPSADYLQEISISMRFMVETNLQILRQQEKILQLLQSAVKDKKK